MKDLDDLLQVRSHHRVGVLLLDHERQGSRRLRLGKPFARLQVAGTEKENLREIKMQCTAHTCATQRDNDYDAASPIKHRALDY